MKYSLHHFTWKLSLKKYLYNFVLVIPSVEEPVPGWVDNLNGPIGLLVGAGKGVIRSMHCKGDNKGQFIPVDYAINASIVVAYLMGAKKIK